MEMIVTEIDIKHMTCVRVRVTVRVRVRVRFRVRVRVRVSLLMETSRPHSILFSRFSSRP
jgi:hypothetical protein